MKQNVLEDLENYTHQAVLYLRELYLQAEGHDVRVRIDTSVLDDERLMAGIKQMESGSAARKGRRGSEGMSGLVDSK